MDKKEREEMYVLMAKFCIKTHERIHALNPECTAEALKVYANYLAISLEVEEKSNTITS